MRLSDSLVRIAILGALAAPAAASAQAKALLPSGTGFSVAGALSVSMMESSGSGLDGQSTKPAGQVELSYGASPRLSLLAAYRPMLATANTQDYTANGYELGLRYLGKAGRPIRPFLEGGFGIRTLRYEAVDVYTSNSIGPWASLGVMRLSTSHWSVEGAATWTRISYGNWKRNEQALVAEATDWTAIGARVGVRYWVRAR